MAVDVVNTVRSAAKIATGKRIISNDLEKQSLIRLFLGSYNSKGLSHEADASLYIVSCYTVLFRLINPKIGIGQGGIA